MYMNVFRSRKRADIDADAYAEDAARMEALAREQQGFLAYRSYKAEDGETVSMSEWESEEHARAWARNLDHAAVQRKGRGDYYQSYTVYSCDEPRVTRFDRSAT
ncbi:MAG: antibiotic biosynthesis monooxygenase [Candidatus Andeanibacterium colombiense]|uniref:Antibiotic biosynthesis monooxygenase n=1 Tax=Candidatus Andeanibacterium colombiense TaxID=3121345 RepID=A0AAJ6BNK5_9SPHN|nr:MAG: antibiotic biosynthesis monooxygenase [Sphingomonadaceae bacterium]